MNTQRTFTRGFLPLQDPLPQLPAPFATWEEIAAQLQKLLLTDHLRPMLERLPPFPVAALQTDAERWRAGSLLAYMSSLYVLGLGGPPATRLPAVLAVPFCTVAATLGVPPILSYAFQAMVNWRRIDPAGPVAVGNLVLLQNFLGGMDEEWFVTLHITIEAAAGRALAQLLPAQAAVTQGDDAAVAHALHEVAATLQTLHDLLGRMEERCDPYIYYHRVRPFMFGWKDNPAMPDGLIYEGVPAFGGRPQQFRGETGAQSGVIPAIDAALGIVHEVDSMRVYLMELRDYMPPADRDFVAALAAGSSIREYVRGRKAANPALVAAYNAAIGKLDQFRRRHVEYAARYILQPAHGDKQGEVGTGGTPFTVYLKKHRQETEAHLL